MSFGMHWHRWTKWSLTDDLRRLRTTGRGTITVKVSAQFRWCQKCDKLEMEYL